jgi:eukaryotic-like serine/threonine-protein kinase
MSEPIPAETKQAQDDERVMSLVELALARPPEDRERYLHSACARDSQLFEEVWRYVRAEQRMNGFLLDPLYPPQSIEHPFAPDDLLDGRFRIVREVAEGGMGIVYEAVDEKLERRIAIKCAKAGFRKRLPPEVRHATGIAHPNICKTFEIHEAVTDHGQIGFLTMEFLEGETLTGRLQREPVPEAEARLIARQLAAGLAEAHRNHVIHGDLKSNNVILTAAADGTLRAVITDFGLARRPETTAQTIQSGVLGGTPDYMAPELWKGEKASLASDVYALGVILHELVSRRRPFPFSENLSWEERLTCKPRPVNPKWDRVLMRCLDPDPARRFHDAKELQEALAPSTTRRWLLAAAAAVVLAVISGVASYERAAPTKESVQLALLPFETAPDTAPLTANLLRDTAAQLAQVKGNARTRFRFLPLKQNSKATHWLHASLSQSDGKIHLHADLTDARTKVNAKDWQAEYAPGELRYVPAAFAGLVTEGFRLPPLAIATAVNAAARAEYLAGIAAVRRDSGVNEALAHAERAVTADSDSPLTYAALAEAQFVKYYLAKDSLFLARATESLRLAELRGRDSARVHSVSGLLKSESGWYEQAIVEYNRAIELDPANSDGYRRLGRAYKLNNQFDESLAAYRRAIEVEPAYYMNYQNLGALYSERARYSEALQAFEEAVRLAPDEPNARFVLGMTYKNLGQFAAAERELRLAVSLGETPRALIELGLTLLYLQREQEAIPYLTRAERLAPEDYLPWYYLEIAFRGLNQKRDAESASRRGLELAEEDTIRNPRGSLGHAFLAYFSARLGDTRRARIEVAQALRLSPDDTDTEITSAATYDALGHREAAVDVLSRSPAQLLADLSRRPDLADLRKDPRFLLLLASHRHD